MRNTVRPIPGRSVPGVLQGVFGNNYTGLPFNGEDGNNPNLAPARSQSRSIGFVLQPNVVQGLTVAVDYSAITLNGFAGGIGFNNILPSINTLGSASPYFNNLGVDNFVGQPAPSQPFVHPGDLQTFLTNTGTGKGDPVQANRLYVVDQFRNLATLIEHSYTINASYAIPTRDGAERSRSRRRAPYSRTSISRMCRATRTSNTQERRTMPAAAAVSAVRCRKYRFFTSFDWVVPESRPDSQQHVCLIDCRYGIERNFNAYDSGCVLLHVRCAGGVRFSTSNISAMAVS